MDFKMIYLA